MPPYWPGGPEGMPPFMAGPPPRLPTRTIEQQRLPVHARLGNRDLVNLTVKKDVQGNVDSLKCNGIIKGDICKIV